MGNFQVVYQKYLMLVLILQLLLITACSIHQNDDLEPIAVEPLAPVVQNTASISNSFPISFTSQSFVNRALCLVDTSQIGSILLSTEIDDVVSYVIITPIEFTDEFPEGYTYTCILINGSYFLLSKSLGIPSYDLNRILFSVNNSIYMTNEIRGANYIATIFVEIREEIPYIIAEIDGLAEVYDIDDNGTIEIISTIGTLSRCSVYFIDFSNELVNWVNLNDLMDAPFVGFNNISRAFEVGFEPNQSLVEYTYYNGSMQKLIKNEWS